MSNTNLTQDAVVNEVISDLVRRSNLGVEKYKTTLADSNLTLLDYLQHAYEETLDHANYLKSAITKLKTEQIFKNDNTTKH